MNVLFLSVGRRVELVKCFKKAANDLNLNNKIIGADISNTAPALYFCDKRYLIPKIGESNYIDSIIEICNIENISIIIPTIDTELLILSENKSNIEDKTKAKVLISNKEVINICRNKINTQEFFEKNNFGVPRQIIEEDIVTKNYKFPLFIKPKDGSSSINAFKVNNKEELLFFKEYVPNPIIQEMISGDEYTIDVFCDFDSKPITIVPRKRLAVRSGEISKGLIKKDAIIIEDIKRLVKVLKPIGHITVQCIKTDNNEIKYLEINPRFGGGAPMSIKAGADSPMNIYKLLMNDKLQYNEDYKDNVICLRFDDAIALDSNGELLQW